jgi:uncharacterized protein
MASVTIDFAVGLRMFLSPRHRHGVVRVAADGTSTVGHTVESLGVPLTEVGEITVNGRPVARSHRPAGGDGLRVHAVRRPQKAPPSFLLDVHLGALARRLRLLGVDAAYRNDLGDDALIEQADRERRVLLTQDRGLLRRRKLWFGAFVRGARPDEQLRDTLDRFAPPLAPWTRCTACNGTLSPVAKETIAHELRPGTRRTYDTFARCDDCGRLYWKGAHHRRLAAIVSAALRDSRPADG